MVPAWPVDQDLVSDLSAWFRDLAVRLRQHDPQDDVDQFPYTYESEDHETQSDQPLGQPEAGGYSRANSSQDLAITRTYQCACHAGDSTRVSRQAKGGPSDQTLSAKAVTVVFKGASLW